MLWPVEILFSYYVSKAWKHLRKDILGLLFLGSATREDCPAVAAFSIEKGKRLRERTLRLVWWENLNRLLIPVPYPMESFKPSNPLLHRFDLFISEWLIGLLFFTIYFFHAKFQQANFSIISSPLKLLIVQQDPELDPSRPHGIKKGLVDCLFWWWKLVLYLLGCPPLPVTVANEGL